MKEFFKKIYIRIGVFPFIIISFVIFAILFWRIELLQATQAGQSFSTELTVLRLFSAVLTNVIVALLVSTFLEMTTLNEHIKRFLQTESELIYDKINGKVTDYSIYTDKKLNEELECILIEIIKRKRQDNSITVPLLKNDIHGYNLDLLPMLLNDCVNAEYLEDYDINFRISIIDSNRIQVTTTTSYTVHNSKNNKFFFSARYPTLETYQSLIFNKVQIFSPDRKQLLKDLTDTANQNKHLVEIKSKQEHHNIYRAVSEVNFADLHIHEYHLEFSRSYIKYLKNGVIVHSIPRPTKNFQAEILITGNNIDRYKLYGLSFFPYKQTSEQMGSRMSETSNGPHNIIVKNHNWCIPGSGVTFTLMENLDKPEDNERYVSFIRDRKILEEWEKSI